ncbi:MAG: RNA polymerase sigma factor [Planctomycetes bacterium]|nr:RNA polymerase sigma factor [Planctomycetota bacterium]
MKPDPPTDPGARDARHRRDSSPKAAVPKAESPKEESDADLVLAVLAGDDRAFERLTDRYHRLVYKIAYSKANDREDADDITQEVFLHVHRSLPNLRDVHAFLGWLLALTHNRANRYCRRRQSKRQGMEEVIRDALEENERRLRREQLGAEVEEVSTAIRDTVAALDEEFRAALTWKYIEGLSYEEIGERLSMSFHQVDYLLRRAKRALRVNLERERTRDDESREP